MYARAVVGREDQERWDGRHAARASLREPAAAVVALAEHLPREGTALDVAGGAGRHAIWLARRGLTVTLVDVSAVALGQASEAADAAGVSLRRVHADLESGLPRGPWDVILCHHYLQRDLFEIFPRVLRPGGVLVVVQPTVRNRERHERPSPRFLLDEGELRRLASGLTVIAYDEGWGSQGRHEATLVATRPAGDGGRAEAAH